MQAAKPLTPAEELAKKAANAARLKRKAERQLQETMKARKKLRFKNATLNGAAAHLVRSAGARREGTEGGLPRA